MYRSELAWKLYERATGRRIGEPLPLKRYDLSSPAVQRKLKERYGGQIPQEELIISPGALFDSNLLTSVN